MARRTPDPPPGRTLVGGLRARRCRDPFPSARVGDEKSIPWIVRPGSPGWNPPACASPSRLGDHNQRPRAHQGTLDARTEKSPGRADPGLSFPELHPHSGALGDGPASGIFGLLIFLPDTRLLLPGYKPFREDPFGRQPDPRKQGPNPFRRRPVRILFRRPSSKNLIASRRTSSEDFLSPAQTPGAIGRENF